MRGDTYSHSSKSFIVCSERVATLTEHTTRTNVVTVSCGTHFFRDMKKGVQKFLIYTGLNFPGLCSHGLNLERPKFDARQFPLMPVESRLPSIPVDFPSSDGQVRSSLSDERTCDECRWSLSDECQCFYLKTLE